MTLNNDERDSMTEERPFKSKKEKQSDKNSVKHEQKMPFTGKIFKMAGLKGNDGAVSRFT